MTIQRFSIILLVVLAASLACDKQPAATADSDTPPSETIPATPPPEPEPAIDEAAEAEPAREGPADVEGADVDETEVPADDPPPETGETEPTDDEVVSEPDDAEPVVDAADEPPIEPESPDAEQIDMILAALEAAGREHVQIVSKVDYRFDERMTGDREQRTGTIKYQRQTEETPSRFYVGFETLQLGDGALLKDKVEYAFDGRWFTIAKHRIKQMTRYELAAEGERIEAFKLGKGPFPLPFGQEAAAMYEHFDITTRDPGEEEPENTWYLRLTPKEDLAEEMSFTRLEMWIDRDRHLPVRLVSRDKNRNVTVAEFDEIQTDVELADRDFHMPRPLGWEYSEQALQD